MYYSGLIMSDIANGPGIRISLFVSGCRNKCKGCFNPETWNFCFGKPFTDEVKQSIYSSMTDYYKGLTLIGGDPMEPENAKELLPFVEEFISRFPTKDIWCYTGYTYEFLGSLPETDERYKLLKLVDTLVDGKFILEERDVTLKFRGSRNQRLINVKESMRKKEIILVNE